jgi:hypothetical protein
MVHIGLWERGVSFSNISRIFLLFSGYPFGTKAEARRAYTYIGASHSFIIIII